RDLRQRIAFTDDAYLGRLDHFVAKYAGGLAFDDFGARPRRCHVIRNGVPVPTQRSTEKEPLVRPMTVDARLALVTCCRIVPNNLIENLVEMMASLARRSPRATLTIVGGVDRRYMDYFKKVCLLIQERGLQNIHFAGPCSDVFGALSQFRAF